MENKLSMINVLFETKREPKENVTALKKGLTMADNLAAFGRIFKVETSVVSRAIAKDVTVLEKSIQTISKRIIRKSDPATLKSFTKQIPDELKLASKELAMKRLWDATQQGNKTLTKTEVEAIINATKSETKILWNESKSAAAAAGKTAASGGKNTKGASSGGKNTKGASSGGKNTKGASSGGKNTKGGKTNVKTVETPPVTNTNFRTVLIDNTKRLGIVKQAGRVGKWVFGRLAKLGLWSVAWTLFKLGLIGWIGYEVLQWLLSDTDGQFPEDLGPIDPKDQDWKKCIVDAFADEGEIGVVDGAQDGDDKTLYVEVAIDEFGGKQTGGWIRFFNDYSVETQSGETGKWDCNQETVKELQEQSETTELTAAQLSRIIDDLDDQLSGDFFEGDASDMLDALNVLKTAQGKTYKGQDAIKVIVYNYPKIKGKELAEHLENLVNLDFQALEAKNEFLSIIGKVPKDTEGNQSDKEQGGGTTKTSKSHITIIWDDEEQGGGGAGGTGKINYKPCDNFPLELGCISDKIKTIQTCMNPTANLKVDGYFGPLTLKAMQDNSYFADNDKDDTTITKSVYDTIMKKCKQQKGDESKDDTKKSERDVVEPVTNLKSKKLEIIPITKLNAEGMIDVHGQQKLLDQAKKRIDGEIVQNIIDNKVKFRGGKFVLKMDEELTENQLVAINRYMAAKGYTLDKKNERLDKSKYVWKSETRDARRIARKQSKIDKIQSKNEK